MYTCVAQILTLPIILFLMMHACMQKPSWMQLSEGSAGAAHIIAIASAWVTEALIDFQGNATLTTSMISLLDSLSSIDCAFTREVNGIKNILTREEKNILLPSGAGCLSLVCADPESIAEQLTLVTL